MRTMMSKLTLMGALLSLPSLMACETKVGCDFRNIEDGLNNGPEDRCQERSNFQSAGFDAVCEGLGGDAVEGGCDTADIVFGCVIGPDVVDWYYPPKTLDDAENECAGDEIIDPP